MKSNKDRIITAIPESGAKSKAIYNDNPCFSEEKLTERDFLRVRKIAGLYAWDIYHLFHYCREIPNGGMYLEIGSYRGGSVLCAYLTGRIIAKTVNFIAIDPGLKPNAVWEWKGKKRKMFFESFRANTKEIPNLRVIPTTSDEAHGKIQNSSVDLIFLDGDHHYKQVKRDIENYWPKLKMGGVFLGHDYSEYHSWWGVIPAVSEFFGKHVFHSPHNSSMWAVRKFSELSTI